MTSSAIEAALPSPLAEGDGCGFFHLKSIVTSMRKRSSSRKSRTWLEPSRMQSSVAEENDIRSGKALCMGGRTKAMDRGQAHRREAQEPSLSSLLLKIKGAGGASAAGDSHQCQAGSCFSLDGGDTSTSLITLRPCRVDQRPIRSEHYPGNPGPHLSDKLPGDPMYQTAPPECRERARLQPHIKELDARDDQLDVIGIHRRDLAAHGQVDVGKVLGCNTKARHASLR